jgi:ankyrin repeat protein
MVRRPHHAFLIVLVMTLGVISACSKNKRPPPAEVDTGGFRIVYTGKKGDLHAAVRQDTISEVKQFLEDGADPNKKDKKGYTPLFIAVTGKHVNMAKWLLYYGGDMKAKMSSYSLLYYAIWGGSLEMVKLVLDNGVDPNDTCMHPQRTPLRMVHGRRRRDMVELIAGRGGRLASPPLITAAWEGDEKKVRDLIAKGADVREVDQYHGNALTFAAAGGHKAIAALLMDKGLKPHGGANLQDPPIYSAAWMGQMEMVRFMVEKGAPGTPELLHHAARSGNIPLVKWIISKGIKVNDAAKESTETALSAAANRGELEMVKFLLKQGARIEGHRDAEVTPLCWARDGGHRAVAKYLEKAGADKSCIGPMLR